MRHMYSVVAMLIDFDKEVSRRALHDVQSALPRGKRLSAHLPSY